MVEIGGHRERCEERVDAVIEHPLVRAVTLTGSGPAGRAVARKAGEMLKKTVLELGGSDPYLVLEDADLELAAAVSTKGRLVNSGQSCIAAKRFVVVDKIRRQFENLFVKRMSVAKMGDPLSAETEVGPPARHDLRDELHRQVEASIAKGARCLLGGKIHEHPGAYYPPTVLTDVVKGMPAYEDELFGPVASVIPVKDEAETVATANDSVFGLGGGVITRDLVRGERIAAGLSLENTSNPRLRGGATGTVDTAIPTASDRCSIVSRASRTCAVELPAVDGK
jgi:succinate-semialdehyde dehydrogenase / glutarate-semialdehyde dehydrogenase